MTWSSKYLSTYMCVCVRVCLALFLLCFATAIFFLFPVPHDNILNRHRTMTWASITYKLHGLKNQNKTKKTKDRRQLYRSLDKKQ